MKANRALPTLAVELSRQIDGGAERRQERAWQIDPSHDDAADPIDHMKQPVSIFDFRNALAKNRRVELTHSQSPRTRKTRLIEAAPANLSPRLTQVKEP